MPVLAGALADRLLIARAGPSGGRVDVSPRYLALLQPLLLGWATLAATDCLPGMSSTSSFVSCSCACAAIAVRYSETGRHRQAKCCTPIGYHGIAQTFLLPCLARQSLDKADGAVCVYVF